MNTKEQYFAKALAYSIKSDYEFIRWLVDTRNFQPEAIAHPSVRQLYISASKSYAKLAPTGRRPSVADVGLEIERETDTEIAQSWMNKIDTMETPDLGMSRDVANALSEEHDRRRVLGYMDSWTAGVKSGEIKGLIGKSFADMTDNVTGMLIGGDASGRPRDILEAARSQKLNQPQSTGYARLDIAIDGGWTPAKFYIIGMPSGHGKTSFCCNMASRRCEVGLPTIIHSLEMPARDLLFRMLCDMAQVPLNVAENPNAATSDTQYDELVFAENLLDNYVRVYDTPADAHEMRRRIRRHKSEFGETAALNQIDHIGIVRRNSRGGNEWSELESMAYSLVSIAQDENVPLIAYSQVPGEVEAELLQSNMVVYNKDLRGSRGIRNAVDYALMGCKHSGIVTDPTTGTVANHHEYRDHSVLQVTKNRRTGKQFWGVFKYIQEFYRLTNERAVGTAEDIYG